MDAEREPRAGTRRQHIAALDGLRGFGALVVVARHTLNAIAMPESSRRAVLEGPLALVLNGNAMVQIFFVAAVLFLPWPRRLASSPPLVGVGEFSYSLYLLHMPVLYVCAPRLAVPIGWGSGLGLLAAVTALSCTFAWAGWRWVERPSIVAGNRVCSWLSRRMGTRALPSALASR